VPRSWNGAGRARILDQGLASRGPRRLSAPNLAQLIEDIHDDTAIMIRAVSAGKAARSFTAPIGQQKSPLSLNGLQQGSAAQNRYYTLHVVGEHIECHLGRNLVSSSHQKVRCTHPSLYGPERMLCRLTTQGHLIGVLIEPLLNLLQHTLVLPTRDAPLGASCARSSS
jgi:hypothetical protein